MRADPRPTRSLRSSPSRIGTPACTWTAGLTTALLAAAFAAASAAAAAERRPSLPYASLLDGPGKSVVAVRFVMRPKERPKGGEGPKVRKVTTGVVTGPRGQVVINAGSFPSPDDGPEATEPADFRILTAEGREIAAEAVGLSRELNLAFLRAKNPEELTTPPITFDESLSLSVGDEVVIIGLLAEPYSFHPAAYRGFLNGQPRGPRKMYSVDTVLPDLCTGGLVVRPDGRPAGLVVMDQLPEAWEGTEPGNILLLFGTANQGKRPGYQMIYPAATFADALQSPPPLDQEDPEKTGWLGITMQALSRDLARYWEIDSPGGVVLGAVLAGSPAEQADLRVGDVILAVDGEPLPIRESKDLFLMQKRIRRAGAGRDIPLSVWRDGTVRELTVRLASSPTNLATAEEYENEAFGITVRQLTYDVVQSLNLGADTRGVLVSKIERAGWAQVAGLSRGDIILKFDGAAVSDINSFRSAVEKAQQERRSEASLLVLRNYKTRFVRVQTHW